MLICVCYVIVTWCLGSIFSEKFDVYVYILMSHKRATNLSVDKYDNKTTIFAESNKYTIENIKKELETENIQFLTQQETLDKDSQLVTSGVWLDFRRLLVRDANVLVDNYAWCTYCKELISYYKTTTTRLQEHLKRRSKKPIVESDAPRKINFHLNELTEIRDAAAHLL